MRNLRPRLHSFDHLGRYRYFLTFSTRQRRKIFVEHEVVNLVMTKILHTASSHTFIIPAYCAMPDHVHLLVKGVSDCSDLLAFVKSAKQMSGYAYAAAHGAPLWQPSYYDHVLRDDETDLFVIAYILLNPVRARLCPSWRDYPFVGSTTASLDELASMLASGLGTGWESGVSRRQA